MLKHTTFSIYTTCTQLSISITWWRHQMETFSALLLICAGNSLVTGEFPAQRPVTRSFDVFFDMRPNKRLSKNHGEAGELRRNRTRYDIIAMRVCINVKYENTYNRSSVYTHMQASHFHLINITARHNERNSAANHRRLDYLLNRLFRCRSKKTSKLHGIGLSEGNLPVTSEFLDSSYHQAISKHGIDYTWHGVDGSLFSANRAPSQYKDRLIYVWRFPC